MTRTPHRAVAFGAALVLTSAAIVLARNPDELTNQAGQRTIFVSAIDSRGVPVPGLGVTDFVVKEDGRPVVVEQAAISTTPMTVALMIDDSGVGLQSMREGAGALVNRLRGIASIAIVTTGGRNIRVMDYTASTPALMGAINRIFTRNVSGAFLTDGLVEVSREFTTREAARGVIVSVGVEGADFSEIRPSEVLATLQRSRALLFMVRLGRPVIGQSNALGVERGESLLDEHTRFNALLGQAPARTGGRLEQLVVHSGIPGAMDHIGVELAGQYAVSYASPNVNGADLRLEVSSTRRGVRVRAPARVGPPR